MTTDTTKAPHCPRCGGEMVRELTPDAFDDAGVEWAADCGACGFGDARIAYDTRKDAEGTARRLVRAELARQALEREMANYDLGYEMARFDALTHYEWLGANPLRLPGEEA